MGFELTKKEVERIKGLFTTYLFYQKHQKSIECWCSRCDKHFFVEKEDKSELAAKLRHRIKHDAVVCCPRCGFSAIAKATGTAKQCKNLWEENRAVVIHRISKERVEAMSFVCIKDYTGPWHGNYGNYTPEVQVSPFRGYELRPGAVRIEERGYYGHWNAVSTVCEPFRAKIGLGYYSQPDNSYSIVGLDKLGNTFLRYHQLKLYANINPVPVVTTELPVMKYLCQFAQYPQMEMLQKMGYKRIVNRMVQGYKGNGRLNWKATKIHEFFKLTKEEYRSFATRIPRDKAVDFLVTRQKMGKMGYPTDISRAAKLWEQTGGEYYLKDALKACDELGEDRRAGVEYILTQAKKENRTFGSTCISFIDYRRMVNKLKLGKSKEVRWPPHLTAAHDRAAAMENALQMERLAKEHAEIMKRKAKEWATQDKKRHEQDVTQEKGYVEQRKKNEKQYSYSGSGFIIRVPATVQEIIDEGRNQSHCVGGYAERHMKGVLTILFLRREEEPDKALYTIEMHDKQVTQVQGFKNRTPLTPEAKVFFDEWLEWVQTGSRRKKDGTPILPQAKRNLKGA